MSSLVFGANLGNKTTDEIVPAILILKVNIPSMTNVANRPVAGMLSCANKYDFEFENVQVHHGETHICAASLCVEL